MEGTSQMSAPPADARFVRIRDTLAAVETAQQPGETFGVLERAAVALVLRARSDLEVLLIKRAVFENDPWSGHMALPGGREEEEDGSLVQTARRETLEETGLVLPSDGLLGELPVVSAQSARLPRFRISPFVFGVEADADAWIASREVEALYWVPLGRLADPAVRSTVTIPLVGSTREFPALSVEGQMVWGLTYRILTRFLEMGG